MCDSFTTSNSFPYVCPPDHNHNKTNTWPHYVLLLNNFKSLTIFFIGKV